MNKFRIALGVTSEEMYLGIVDCVGLRLEMKSKKLAGHEAAL